MILTRKNPRAGRGLTAYPLYTEDNGMLAHKLGYCGGCSEVIGIRTVDIDEFVAFFWKSKEQYKKLLGKLEPKPLLRRRFIKWLIGKLGEYPVPNEVVYN